MLVCYFLALRNVKGYSGQFFCPPFSHSRKCFLQKVRHSMRKHYRHRKFFRHTFLILVWCNVYGKIAKILLILLIETPGLNSSNSILINFLTLKKSITSKIQIISFRRLDGWVQLELSNFLICLVCSEDEIWLAGFKMYLF